MMMIELATKERLFIAGGKNGTCHIIEPIKKGLELGGMVLCLSLDREDRINLGRVFRNEDTRKAIKKAGCGVLVGSLIESFSHFAEWVTKVEC